MSARRRADRDRIVWSSERGDLRSPRSRPRDEAAVVASDGIIHVRLETKGRGGKTVTTVSGVPLPEPELRDLAKDLKRRCGTGGALKQAVIEIQGDHRATLIAELEARGYTVSNRGDAP